jgi:hypothetical protein
MLTFEIILAKVFHSSPYPSKQLTDFDSFSFRLSASDWICTARSFGLSDIGCIVKSKTSP